MAAPSRAGCRPRATTRLGGGPVAPVALAVLAVLAMVVAGLLTADPAVAGHPRAGATAPVAAVAGDGGEAAPGATGEPAGERLPEPEVPTDEADERADEILADPAYHEPEPEPGLLERILQWILDRLPSFDTPGTAGGGGSALIGWIFIALLVGLAIFLVARVRLNRRPRDDEPDYVVEAEVDRSHTEWVGEAERFEAAGQWKQALRCRFRALVAALIERGAVRDLPGRTTGEYRVEIGRSAPAVAAPFAAAADLFDRAWYGDEPTGPEENRSFRALADEVVLGVDVVAAAPVGEPAGSGSPIGAGDGRSP